MGMTFEEMAERYVELGWKVFPLAAGTKVPAIAKDKGGNGCKDATDDWSVIRAWSAAYPGCNIGVATGQPSGIVVVDIDPRNGGMDTAKRWKWPKAPLQRTQSGGYHMVFAHTAALKNSKSRLGPGVDIKTTGGYIVGAPSTIVDPSTGEIREYVWVRPARGADLPQVPDEVLKALAPKPEKKFSGADFSSVPLSLETYEGAIRHAESQGEGNRNNALFWAACRVFEGVRAGKVGEAEALNRLMQAGKVLDLPMREIQATLGSAMQRGSER